MVDGSGFHDDFSRTKCPFYGFDAVAGVRVFVDSEGNQCPFVTKSYSPCAMEVDGKDPCWDDCSFYNTEGNVPIIETLLNSRTISPRELDESSVPLRKWYDHIVNGKEI